MSSLMSSSFAAMTPFCGQYAPLTASAKWSQESFAELLSSAASWLHLATLACICLRLSAGYTCVTCLWGAGTCGIHIWPLRASQMLYRPCGGRFYCQLCYILIKSSLSTISLCQIGFLISANVRINQQYSAGKLYSLSFFSAIATKLPKIYQIGHHAETNFSQAGMYCAQNKTSKNLLVFTINASNIYFLL